MMQRAQAFLAEQRRLGFQARNPGYALISFASFVERRGHQGPLTVELMAEWARRDKARRGTAETWARRLKILRPFARWMRQFEPRTAVPDELIFGPVPGRVAPHIYRDEEIVALLAAARALHPQGGLRPATFEAVFGLLASTGLRVSEALALRDADVDLGAGTLTVRRTKFMKSRLVPLHWSTVEALPAAAGPSDPQQRADAVLHRLAWLPIGPRHESTPGASRLHRTAQPAGMD
jgi:integrase